MWHWGCSCSFSCFSESTASFRTSKDNSDGRRGQAGKMVLESIVWCGGGKSKKDARFDEDNVRRGTPLFEIVHRATARFEALLHLCKGDNV